MDFDPAYYLRMNPDVAASGMNPLLHYAQYGRTEGRLPAHPEPAAPAPSPLGAGPMNPNDPAAWDAFRQRAFQATEGINRMPFMFSNTGGLPNDAVGAMQALYPSFGAPTAPAPAEAPVQNLGMNLGPFGDMPYAAHLQPY